MVAVELVRLLRRSLLVTVLGIAGWVLFAAPASADELPPQNQPLVHQPASSGGLLGGLLGGVSDTLGSLTDAVAGLTGAVADTTHELLAPVTQPSRGPVGDMPVPLPAPTAGTGSASGSTTTVRVDVPVAEVPAPVAAAAPAPAPVPAPAPAPTPVAPPVVVEAVAPAPVVRHVVAPVAPPAPVAVQDDGGSADEHADRGGSDPKPVKAPAAPSGPGSTVSTAHDSSGGARGTHGVLTSQATLHPADAGFSTRSRAVDAAGRDAGLPASSPD